MFGTSSWDATSFASRAVHVNCRDAEERIGALAAHRKAFCNGLARPSLVAIVSSLRNI